MDNNDKKNDGKRIAAFRLAFLPSCGCSSGVCFSYLSKQFEREFNDRNFHIMSFFEQLSAQEKYNATHNADGSAKTAISGSSSVQETTESNYAGFRMTLQAF